MTSPSARKPGAPTLSPRQRELVDLVDRGLTQKAIAAALGVSERTVEEQLGRARRRFGVRTTTQLLARVRARDARRPHGPVRDSHDVEIHN